MSADIPIFTSLLPKALLLKVRNRFLLDWSGIHGLPHWKRVHQNGIRIASLRGKAEFARSLHGSAFDLPKTSLELLCLAIRDHSNGQMSLNSTIQTCWDSDRLDLWRVGVRPSPKYLSREAAGLLRGKAKKETPHAYSLS